MLRSLHLLFNKQITEKRQISEINKIPLSQGVVLKNELIVDANIRITNDVLQKLNELLVDLRVNKLILLSVLKLVVVLLHESQSESGG